MASYSRLKESTAAFDQMMDQFGVITVMNAHIYDYDDTIKSTVSNPMYASDYVAAYQAKGDGIKLETLKIANVPMEGPTKTITGGQDAAPLLKFGKTARLEMQDALGHAEAIEALCGGVVEYSMSDFSNKIGLHNGLDFSGHKTIIGDSFFIDQKTGTQVNVNIIFYKFLPDSLFNLTQDAEGDATVFDMNGDLQTEVVAIGDENGVTLQHKFFYSIVPVSSGATGRFVLSADNKQVTVTLEAGEALYDNGTEVTATVPGTATVTGAGPHSLEIIKGTQIIAAARYILVA